MPRPTTLVPESATIGPNGRRVCGARTRGGAPDRRCLNPPIPEGNGRCRFHGGATPRGINSPNTVTGRYSQDLPTRVAARYESALTDPNLLSVRDDIALLQGAITDIMAELREAENRPDLDAVLGSVETIATQYLSWDWTRMQAEMAKLKELIVGRQSQRAALREIRELIKEKSTLVAQENRLLLDRQQMISVEQYMLGMRALGSAVRRMIDDPQVLRAIDVEFRRIASVPDRTG